MVGAAAWQVPVPLQRLSVFERDCVPVALQTSAVGGRHRPNVPNWVAAQVWPEGENPFAGQLGVLLHDSATSQLPAAARHTLEGPKFVQVPLVGAPVATLHAWHDPVQAESQQTPLTQKALEHSVALAHARPAAFFAEQ